MSNYAWMKSSVSTRCVSVLYADLIQFVTPITGVVKVSIQAWWNQPHYDDKPQGNLHQAFCLPIKSSIMLLPLKKHTIICFYKVKWWNKKDTKCSLVGIGEIKRCCSGGFLDWKPGELNPSVSSPSALHTVQWSLWISYQTKCSFLKANIGRKYFVGTQHIHSNKLTILFLKNEIWMNI